MFEEYKLVLDSGNDEGLIENVTSLINSFSLELVPAFKLRNTDPQHFFDNFIGKYVAYLLLLQGKRVNNFTYNSYWLENSEFADLLLEQKIELLPMENIHVEYWFKDGDWENAEEHYHTDRDEFINAFIESNKGSSELRQVNKPMFTTLVYLSDNMVPTLVFNNKGKNIYLSFPETLKSVIFDGANNIHGHYKNLYKDLNKRSLIAINVFPQDVKYTPYLDINQLYQWHYMKKKQVPVELPLDINLKSNKLVSPKEITINSTTEEVDEFNESLRKNIVNSLVYNKYIARILSEINDTVSTIKSYKISINDDIYAWTLYDQTEKIHENDIHYEDFNPYESKYMNIFREREIISKECREILIQDANMQTQMHFGGWTNNRHVRYPTYDIAIDKLSPSILKYILLLFSEKLGPLLLDNFDINPEAYKLNIKDAFIVKYDENKQRSLEYHSDDSDMSIIVTLSDDNDYSGGGTQFKNGLTIKATAGDAIMFGSKYKHQGLEIYSGIRMILVFFINVIK